MNEEICIDGEWYRGPYRIDESGRDVAAFRFYDSLPRAAREADRANMERMADVTSPAWRFKVKKANG